MKFLNKKEILLSVSVMIFVLGLLLSSRYIYAIWSSPISTPPNSNKEVPINTGTSSQIKNGMLTINSGVASGLLVSSGNVGIGNVAPTLKLDVAGELRIGNTNAVCVASIEGAIRYSSVKKSIEYCDGISWGEFVPMDKDPLSFSFTNLTNQNLNALITSNSIIPMGYLRSTVLVAGSGNPQVNCNNTGWTSSCLLYEGQPLQARLTTPGTYLTDSPISVVVGSISNTWHVTTRAIDNSPDAFSFNNLSTQELNTLVYSNILAPTGYDNANVTVSGAGSPQVSCGGGAWSTSCFLVVGQTLQIRQTTSAIGSTANTASVVVGGTGSVWTATTKEIIECTSNASWNIHVNGDIYGSWNGSYFVICKPCYFTTYASGGYLYMRGNITGYADGGKWILYSVCRKPL